MLKKTALFIAMLASTVAFADAPIMKPITQTVLDQPFTVTQQVWGYQFNNETNKQFTFTTSVPTADPSKTVTVEMQCWHKGGAADVYMVSSGQTISCTDNDSIRLVTPNNQQPTVSGTYSIVVSSK